MKRNDLRPVIAFAFGIILVFFGLVLQPFTEATLALTLHLGFIPVLTKVLCDIGFVQLVVKYNETTTESLSQETNKQ